MVDCGLTPWEYEELTLYDLMLYIQKIDRQNEIEKSKWENGWNQTRIIWATLRNQWLGKNAKPSEPEDLIKLSFDKKEENEVPEKLSFKEAKERYGSKLKNGSK